MSQVLYQMSNVDGQNGTLTVFGDFGQKAIAHTHPKFSTLVTYLVGNTEHDEEYIDRLLNPAKFIGHEMAQITDRITYTDRNILLDGVPIQQALHAHIRAKVEAEDISWQRVIRFVLLLDENPSKRAKDAVWGWIEKHGVSLAEDGRMIGYKGLVNGTDAVTGETDIPVSYHSGPNNFIDGQIYGEPGTAYQVPHRLNTVISKKRGDVDDNSKMACSTGLHVGAYSYAKTFGENRADGARYSTMGRMADSLPNSTFALVAFSPADVVSVPEDNTSDWKIRVSKYEVVEFLEEVTDTLRDRSSYDHPAKVEVPVGTSAPFIPDNEKSAQVPNYVPEPVEEEVEPEQEDVILDGDSNEPGDVAYDEDFVPEEEIRVDVLPVEALSEAPTLATSEPEDVEPVVALEDRQTASSSLTLDENSAILPDLRADLLNPEIGHKALARTWAHLTTESSVRRWRKKNYIAPKSALRKGLGL